MPSPKPSIHHPPPTTHHSLLIILILTFTLYFSWYTIQRYQTLHAYTADLSLIDQAMWNTLHGRFLEATWGDHQQPRLAEHFEPILIPLATLFWLWDDVRILLIVQAFALAIGALPVYWIAAAVFKPLKTIPPTLKASLPIFFVILYLFSPPLQAAAVADFHADPFVVAPFLFAFWYATQHQWKWMWLWAIVVMMTKENMPTLMVMLGLYVLIVGKRPDRLLTHSQTTSYLTKLKSFWAKITLATCQVVNLHGVGLIVVGVLWFVIATFGIVAPLAAQHFGSDGPVYLANRFSTNPLEWLALLRDPIRLSYLGGLIATTGGLALLAPHYLLLGLPIFIANTFSNFPGQYSGEQHYSAPLVAILTIAAIYGTKKLFHVPRPTSHVSRIFSKLILLPFAIALIIAIFYHLRYGWTPLSFRTEVYLITTHTQLLPRFLAQIPDDVPISASAAVHPHLAHRPVAYTFPTVQEAEFILVDVTDVPGTHPNDVYTNLQNKLDSANWQLLDASDGFILLKKAPSATPQNLPPEFFNFARTTNPTPQHPLSLNFGGQIKLLGYDVLDKPFHRQTSIRLYWQALQPSLSSNLTVWPQFYTTQGQAINHPLQQPAIQAVWYPPSKWQFDEIIITETLPQNLGSIFHLGIAVLQGDNLTDFNQRLPIVNVPPNDVYLHDQATWATIATFQRQKWALEAMSPNLFLESILPLNIQFEDGLELVGVKLPVQAHFQEQPLPITLLWQTTASLPSDYTVFLHLLDADGNTIAQTDALPTWLVPFPTTRWQPNQPILDSHTFPAPLPQGTYHLRLGLYTWHPIEQTLQHLPLSLGGDSVVLTQTISIN